MHLRSLSQLKRVIISIAFCLLLVPLATAQSDKFDIAVGYAGLWADISPNLSAIDLNRKFMNGWQVAGIYNANSYLGLEVQANGFYKGLTAGGNIPLISSLKLANLSLYTVTFGPQLKFGHGPLQPFVHGLVGVARGNISTNGILNFIPIPTNLRAFNDTAFAADIGGGVDFFIVPRVSVRGEGAYVYTHFPFSDLSPTEDNSQNHLKFAASLVFHL